MKDIVVIGGSGCAKEVLFLLEENNKIQEEFHILGVIDSIEGPIMGYPVLGDDEWLVRYKKPICAVCAINSPKIRKRIVAKFEDCKHITFPTIISRHALIGDKNYIGHGCVICSGVTITTDVQIGNHVIVNIGSTISHDTQIKDYSSINPGVNLSGNVEIGKETEVGVGAKIIQGIRIGKRAMVGAGAVVIRNVDDDCTVAGVPAKVIDRKR